MDPYTFRDEIARPAPQNVEVAGRVLHPGSRVLLRPRPGLDPIDSALSGQVAIIEAIEEDDTGSKHVAVIMENDPGRGLGRTRHIAHRFFFAPGELEPMDESSRAQRRRVLVAGVGNLFLGDDGFGVAVAQRLLKRQLPAGVEVVDYGIRGLDLVYALGEAYHAAVLIDVVPGEGLPGALVVLEAGQEEEDTAATLDVHRMDPLAVLRLARRLGPLPGQVFIVGCTPEAASEEWRIESVMSLSIPVAAAVDKAADLVEELVAQLVAEPADTATNDNHKGVLP